MACLIPGALLSVFVLLCLNCTILIQNVGLSKWLLGPEAPLRIKANCIKWKTNVLGGGHFILHLPPFIEISYKF